MSGLEILNRMKNDLHLVLIPVIAISASRNQQTVESSLLHGAAEYLYSLFLPCFAESSRSPSRCCVCVCAAW